MRNVTIIQLVATAMFLLFFTTATCANSSKDFARKGQAMWSAFVCSALASASGNPKEEERLFLYGYNEGKELIEAMKANKIKDEDISNETPVAVLTRLQGPTTDFMLGRIFEASQESALEDVFKTGEHYNSKKDRQIIAENKFLEKNCKLIGKHK